jgi:hypothetical protein
VAGVSRSQLAVLDVFRTLIQYFGKDMGDKLHSLVLDFTLPLLDAPKVDLRKRASVTLGTPRIGFISAHAPPQEV